MQGMDRGSRLVLTVFALALPFKAAGCGRTACITVTASQLQNGACPMPNAAQARFSSALCPGPTVEGPGILDDGLCCYPVEVADSSVNCATLSGTGVGAFAASASASGGFGGTGGTGGSSGSTCAEALKGAPFTQVTGTAHTNLTNLEMCACGSGSDCAMICDQDLCIGNAPANGCTNCLLSTCSMQLLVCQES